MGSNAAAVLVPVKAFGQAKQRLAEVLDASARRSLAIAMAETVVAAAGDLRVAVVCDDDEVRTWAEALGAEAVWTPDLGLNGAVEAGIAHLARRGTARVVVVHADLPLATDLGWLADTDGATLVPDRHHDGTNVLSVPTGIGFVPAYGAGGGPLGQRGAAPELDVVGVRADRERDRGRGQIDAHRSSATPTAPAR